MNKNSVSLVLLGLLANIGYFFAMKTYTDTRQVRIVKATEESTVEIASLGPIIKRTPFVKFKGLRHFSIGYHYKKIGFGHNMLGTGVIVRNDGLIMTADHVIHGTSLAEVNLDAFKYSPRLIRGFKAKKIYAAVIAEDEINDIALLKIVYPAQYFRAVNLRDTVEKGLPVFTIGFPGHFKKHVTAGIVSSFDDGFTITDAVISQGSSGGGLFDANGDLVGLCSYVWYMNSIEVYQGFAGFTNLEAMHKLLEKYKDL